MLHVPFVTGISSQRRVPGCYDTQGSIPVVEGIEALKSLIPHSARLGVYIKYPEKKQKQVQ